MKHLMPAHWATAPLEELTTKIGSGATPRGGKNAYKASGIPLIRSMNIHFHGFVDAGLVLLDDEQAEKLKSVTVEPDDVLLNITGASIGRVTTAPSKMEGARVNQHVSIIRSNGGFQPRFVSHFLASPEMQREIMETQSGATRQALTKAKIGNFQIPLPPLKEQRRIADKIDALQAKSRRAREALETVGPLLEKFRQSVLAAAFRGDLTAEWRKQHPDVEPAEKLLERIRAERRARWEEAELAKMRAKAKAPKNDKWKAKYKEPETVDATGLPGLPEGWCWTNLGNLIHSIEAGKSPRASSTPATGNEKGVLKVSAVSWGEFNANENKRLQDDFQLEGIPTVQAGDLLISRANTVELVGAVVVTKADHPNLILSDKILRLNVASDSCPSEFLKFALRTKWVRLVFEDQATGTSNSMRNLSQGKIMSAPIPLPTEPEVEQIVQLLSKSEEGLKSHGQLVRKGKNKITGLDQSILAKAFRGELVLQDPNDEPASVLLERIKAERETAKCKKKTRRKKK